MRERRSGSESFGISAARFHEMRARDAQALKTLEYRIKVGIPAELSAKANGPWEGTPPG
jgi:hypothetical protein